MVGTDEVRKNQDQIQFSLAALGEERLQPKAYARNSGRAVGQAAVATQTLELDGIKLLIGMAFGVCLVSMFFWGFFRHWLFLQ